MPDLSSPDLGQIVARQRELLAELATLNAHLSAKIQATHDPRSAAEHSTQHHLTPTASRPVPPQQPVPRPGERPYTPPGPAGYARPPAYPHQFRPTYPPRPTPTSAPQPPQIPFWERPGAVPRVLAGLGIAVTLVGVALLLTLAWQYGYFKPPAQLAAATLLAASLLTGGVHVHTQDPTNVGSTALIGTGLATAYLTVFIASGYYHFLPVVAGLALAGAIAIGGLLLGRKWRNQGIAVSALLGITLLAPTLGTPPLVAGAFILLATSTSSLIALGLPWPALRATEVLPVTLVLLWVAGSPHVYPLVLTIAGAFAMVNAAIAVWSVRVSAPTCKLSIGLMIVAALPLAAAAIEQNRPWGAGALAVAGIAYTAVAAWRDQRARALSSSGLATGATMITLAAGVWFEPETLPIVLSAFAISYLAASRYLGKPAFCVGATLQSISASAWLIRLDIPWNIEICPKVPALVETLVLLASVVMLIVMIRTVWPVSARTTIGRRTAIGACIVLGSVAIIEAGTIIGRATGSALLGYQASHITVTIAWIGLSAVAFGQALRAQQPMIFVYTGLALAIASVAKLFLYDLGQQPTLVRSIGFLVVGVSLLLIGTRYARAFATKKQQLSLQASAPPQFRPERPGPESQPTPPRPSTF